jgi:cytochrome c-type protein NapC
MGSSTSADASQVLAQPLAVVAIVAAVLAAACLVYYLIKRPSLGLVTKLVLLAGLGVFPLITAGSGNLVGFEATTTRQFCGGCHVMEPWVADANDPRSTGLAARHGRNALFGDKNCYTCHADYGMYGAVATKINGLHHVAAYLRGYHRMPVDQALAEIRLYRPYPNANCTHCHSTTLPGFAAVPDHKIVAQPGDAEASCASAGCHGPAHPFAAKAQAAAGHAAEGAP